MPNTNTCILLLGSNQSDRAGNLSRARHSIGSAIGAIKKCSSIYETEAWGMTDQPSFYNQVCIVYTENNPGNVLEKIEQIETQLGRSDRVKWGPRVIDIDILFYNEEVVDSEDLKIPHPLLHERRFALIPLQEIIPEFVHPQLGKTISELTHAAADKLQVTMIIPAGHAAS
jgi:2-amino-4-hydroxy-6-hydroxymethyldihydropteridine diphosphokinase